MTSVMRRPWNAFRRRRYIAQRRRKVYGTPRPFEMTPAQVAWFEDVWRRDAERRWPA